MNKVGLQFLSPEITFIIMDFAPEISSLSLTCKKLNQVANGWLEKTNTQILNFYPPLLNELIENTRVIGKKNIFEFLINRLFIRLQKSKKNLKRWTGELNEVKELEKIEKEFNCLSSDKKMNWACNNFPLIIEIIKPEEEKIELLLKCITCIHIAIGEPNAEEFYGLTPKSNSIKNYSSGKLNPVRTRKISL